MFGPLENFTHFERVKETKSQREGDREGLCRLHQCAAAEATEATACCSIPDFGGVRAIVVVCIKHTFFTPTARRLQ